MLRGAEKMSFAEIEQEIVRLGTKAKDGALTVEDMVGGTFSITNGGAAGSTQGRAPTGRPAPHRSRPAPHRSRPAPTAPETRLS